MNQEQRSNIIAASWEIHSLVETSYRQNWAKKGDHEWLEKQRMLLADMAIHLLQTALKPDELNLEKLKNNIHAILTISDQFLPQADLIKATEKLYAVE
ncbi:hypothetical protein [Glaciecola sp. 1036]|uniref:hypothetical protein n=1 Tax=Alteromonadaceae TaxID=72275 RepID=UPI003D0541E4